MRPNTIIVGSDMIARHSLLSLALGLALTAPGWGQDTASSPPLVLVPGAVWDGVTDAPHQGWVVMVQGSKIAAAGPAHRVTIPQNARRLELPGTTLIPGLIEGHSHLFLHPYNEALWDDQVLKEPAGVRMARAVAHAAATLRAGVTTVRDLGTEGMANYDVQLRQAVEQGIVPGPRILASTRAIVATGSYAPRRTNYAFEPLQGAEEASGAEQIEHVVRDQIGRGADWIKVYADYGWGPDGKAKPTFSQAELNVLVATARAMRSPAGSFRTWSSQSVSS